MPALQNSQEIQTALNSLKHSYGTILESHESQLNQVQGRLKAFDSELENTLDIKISNQMRLIKQTINERLTQINQDYTE